MSNEVSCDSVARRANESWMRDFFEQETSDFLCLGVVSRRTNIRFVE